MSQPLREYARSGAYVFGQHRLGTFRAIDPKSKPSEYGRAERATCLGDGCLVVVGITPAGPIAKWWLRGTDAGTDDEIVASTHPLDSLPACPARRAE
jgi:hypothetical protein